MAMNATLKEISRNFFRDMSLPYAEQLGLEKLSSHFDVVVYSCLFFTLAQHVIVPALSKVFCPKSYGAIKGRYARNKWLSLCILQLIFFVLTWLHLGPFMACL